MISFLLFSMVRLVGPNGVVELETKMKNNTTFSVGNRKNCRTMVYSYFMSSYLLILIYQQLQDLQNQMT